jgi:hypothetical protein
MYSKIKGGNTLNIQGLECNIPPVGYVVNIITGQLEQRDIWRRSDVIEEQYWERRPYPSWYKKKIKEQDDYNKKKKEDEPEFYDEQLDEYIKQEWDRRLNGFWFMNNGEPVYLTGFYYMLLQWFCIDIGYSTFTIPHLHKLYFLEYCIEDPVCMGMIDITKRRFLKTFIGGLFILEYTTRTKMANGALQSKTGNDAKKVFGKAVVYPFRKFPRFFRPEYDMSLGVNPKTELRFQQTNVRGKKAEESIDKDELGSMIDWGSADPVHYDGSKIHRYFSDEWGKTTEANIFDRHEVIRYCLMDERSNIIGKCLYSTTVEKLDSDKDGVQEAAKTLWEASDQNNREANGRTQSGLYRFFQTSDEANNFDIYGYPDVEKTVTNILLDREAVKGSPRSLAARIRKEPRTIKEAFYTDGDKCLFDSIAINEQLDWLSYNQMTERGNLVWRDGHEYYKEVVLPNGEKSIKVGELIWVANDNGEYEKVKGWMPKEMNSVSIRNGNFRPNGNYAMRIGCDPFKYDKTKSTKKSDGVAYGFQMEDALFPDDEYANMFTISWAGRPATTAIQYDRVLRMAWFCGCQVLFERNVYEWKGYFISKKCGGFLMWLPGELEPGIFTGGNADNGTIQLISDQINTHIDSHIKKVYFKRLMEEKSGWLGLRVEETQEFDDAMSSGITLIAAKSKKYKPENKYGLDINNIMPLNKAI